MNVLITDITEQIPALSSSVLAIPLLTQNQLIEIHDRDRTNYNIEYIVHCVLNLHQNHRFRHMSFSKQTNKQTNKQ